MLLEDSRPDHEVRDPGIVFQRNDHHPLRASRPLPHEDYACSLHPAAVTGAHRFAASRDPSTGKLRTQDQTGWLRRDSPVRP